MPNLPVLVGAAMTAYVLSPEVSDDEHELIKTYLSSVGSILHVENEDKLDAVTALSGSGPAYVSYFIENMTSSAESLGFSYEDATQLVWQTFRGTVKYLEHNTIDPTNLRKMVTSKGGTTAAAIEVFEKHKLSNLVEAGIKAAYIRAKELGNSAK